MTNVAKQNISGIICVGCAVLMVFCIARMIPYGIVGEVGKVKAYFAGMLVGLVFGLPSGVAYYYYRSRSSESGELGRMRIETATLARTAQKPAAPRYTAQKRK